MHQVVDGLQALVQIAKERVEGEAAALPEWYGGAEPISAEAPRWPQGSLGDRFLTGTYLGEAQDAPCLLTAQIPDAAVIAADPAHWNIATRALIRAVIFDGLKIDHPAVSMLLEVLAPIAAAELAYGQAVEASLHSFGPDWDETEPEFPELDGPVFLLGGRALVEAAWATVGEDPLSEVLGGLLPVPRNTAANYRVTPKCCSALGTLAATCWRISSPPGPRRPETSSRWG
jgi:hypothetical protein